MNPDIRKDCIAFAAIAGVCGLLGAVWFWRANVVPRTFVRAAVEMSQAIHHHNLDEFGNAWLRAEPGYRDGRYDSDAAHALARWNIAFKLSQSTEIGWLSVQQMCSHIDLPWTITVASVGLDADQMAKAGVDPATHCVDRAKAIWWWAHMGQLSAWRSAEVRAHATPSERDMIEPPLAAFQQ